MRTVQAAKKSKSLELLDKAKAFNPVVYKMPKDISVEDILNQGPKLDDGLRSALGSMMRNPKPEFIPKLEALQKVMEKHKLVGKLRDRELLYNISLLSNNFNKLMKGSTIRFRSKLGEWSTKSEPSMVFGSSIISVLVKQRIPASEQVIDRDNLWFAGEDYGLLGKNDILVREKTYSISKKDITLVDIPPSLKWKGKSGLFLARNGKLVKAAHPSAILDTTDKTEEIEGFLTQKEIQTLDLWITSVRATSKGVKILRNLQKRMVKEGRLKPVKQSKLYRGVKVPPRMILPLLRNQSFTLGASGGRGEGKVQSWATDSLTSWSFATCSEDQAAAILVEKIPAKRIIFTMTKKFVKWVTDQAKQLREKQIGLDVVWRPDFLEKEEIIVEPARTKYTLCDNIHMLCVGRDLWNDNELFNEMELDDKQIRKVEKILLSKSAVWFKCNRAGKLTVF